MTEQTPLELGYRMPAEWEPHEGTWVSWPKDEITFPGRAIGAVEDIYAKAIGAIQKGEKVFVLVNDYSAKNHAKETLKNVGTNNVEFYCIPSVDVWTRDYAPTFVKNKEKIAAVKWKFNAWGGKYPALKYDNKTGMQIAEASDARIFKADIVMERGVIDSNGAGTVLTTEQCLLNKNRNPHLAKKEIENYLMQYTGTESVI